MTATRCYLDWNAGAPLLPEARTAIAALLEVDLGNASSVHAEGRAARALVGGCGVYGPGASPLANTRGLGMPSPLPAGAVVASLDLRGFAVSSGSACSSGVERGSAVVEAMGFASDAARRTVRVALGPATAPDDVCRFVDALADAVVAGGGGRS